MSICIKAKKKNKNKKLKKLNKPKNHTIPLSPNKQNKQIDVCHDLI